MEYKFLIVALTYPILNNKTREHIYLNNTKFVSVLKENRTRNYALALEIFFKCNLQVYINIRTMIFKYSKTLSQHLLAT